MQGNLKAKPKDSEIYDMKSVEPNFLPFQRLVNEVDMTVPKNKTIPNRLLNECCFCHKKGLKPGILAVEFPKDEGAHQYFSSAAKELPLNINGMCRECAELTAR